MRLPEPWHRMIRQKRGQKRGFKYFLFSFLFGEDFQFDDHIFQMGGSTTN